MPRIVHGLVVGARKRPRRRAKLALRGYLPFQVSEVPDRKDWSLGAGESAHALYLNDWLGCCVIAQGYHIEGIATGNAGAADHSDAYVAPDSAIVADYEAIGGYRQGHPETDQGCDEITAFEYWMSHGFASGTKLAGFASVNPADRDEVKAAIYLFENLAIGMELPDAWLAKPPEDGDVWDMAGPPNPSNGHAVTGCGYDLFPIIGVEREGVTLISWGRRILLTWEALAYYASPERNGSCHVLLTPDILGRGQSKSPSGVDWPTLVADLQTLNGLGAHPAPIEPSIPPPAPEPPFRNGDRPTPIPPALHVSIEIPEWKTTENLELRALAQADTFLASVSPPRCIPATLVAARVKTLVTEWQRERGAERVTRGDVDDLERAIVRALRGA